MCLIQKHHKRGFRLVKAHNLLKKAGCVFFERTCDIFQKPMKSHRSPKIFPPQSFTKREVSVSTSVSPASPSPEFSLPNFEGFRKDFRRLRSQPCHPKVWWKKWEKRCERCGESVNPSKKFDMTTSSWL